MYIYVYIYVYIHIYTYIHTYIYIYIYYISIYVLTLSDFCVKCQIFHSNTTRHFFKIVIFQDLRIFNRLLQTKSVKSKY